MLLLEPLCQLEIINKDTGATQLLGEIITDAQIDFVLRVERQLERNGRIRMVVLKARQMGFSTIIEGILFLLSMYYDNLESLIVSHERPSAQGLLRMTKRYWESYPFGALHDQQYGGRTVLSWTDTGSMVEVATAKNLEGGRSRTIRCLHASEVAFWPDGEGLMTGLSKTIPATGFSAIFLESTANGIGNYFHTQWLSAKAGVTEFEPCFYAWWQHPEYTIERLDDEQRAKYEDLGELDKEEKRIKRLYHLTDGQLRWRRWAIANQCNGKIDEFRQEYPCDPSEAFLSSGSNVFPLEKLLQHYEPRIGAKGKLVKNRNRVEFMEAVDGPLTIYRLPSVDKDWGMYRIGADPTHTMTNDWACGQVIHRRTMEQVAVLRMKDDPVRFAEQLYLLGEFYNWARIVPEKEGPGYATVGALAAMNYPDLWRSVKIDQTPGKPVDGLYGWSTNVATKPMAIGYIQYALNQPIVQMGAARYGLLIHDETTFNELRDYVTVLSKRGAMRYANGTGSDYDDGVMALGIGVATELIDADLPAYTGGMDPSTPRSNVPARASARPQSGSGIDPDTLRAIAEMPMGQAQRTPTLATAAGGDVSHSPHTLVHQDEAPPWEDWE